MPYCKNCGSEIALDAKFCPKCGAPATFELTAQAPQEPAQTAASGLKLAFWGERFVAWLIDVIILGVIIGFLSLFAWFAFGTFTLWPSWVPFFNFNFGGILYFLYWFLMDGIYGQSLGKMVMRLRVVRLDGGRVNMGQAALESVGKAFLLPIDLIVGWIFYPQRRQRLFNNLSGTVVIRETAP